MVFLNRRRVAGMLASAAFAVLAGDVAGCGDDSADPIDGSDNDGGGLDASTDRDTPRDSGMDSASDARDSGSADADGADAIEASACGNGVVDVGEVCDIAIATGPGTCPTGCNDNVVCTKDELVTPGTCGARCTNTPIVAPANGDGCCPSGANAANDDDCNPICGNGAIEPGEACDDGNTVSGDGCSAGCAIE